jgi:hypothetical protein
MPSIQIKRGTSSALSSNNPIIPTGEFVFATDTLILKVGDGSSTWSQLNPIAPEEITEYQNTASFPASGNSALLYISTDTSRFYRWTGSQYIEVGAGGSYLPNHASSHYKDGSDAILVDCSQIYSGTLDFARLPTTLASSTEARQITESTKILTSARMRESLEATWVMDGNWFNHTTGNGGSSAVPGNSTCNWVLSTGTTANGYVVARIGTGQFIVAKPGAQGGTIGLVTPKRFVMRFYRYAGSTNGILRVQYGGKDNNSASPGQLTTKGFGFELRGTRIWLIAHNGTSLTQVDSSTDISSATANSSIVYEVCCTSDGAGNCAVLLNGISVATTTSGPNSDLVYTGTPYGMTVEVTNGGDTSQNQFYLHRQLYLSGTFS